MKLISPVVVFNFCDNQDFILLQDSARYFLETASQQLLGRGHYGPTSLRAVQNVMKNPINIIL